MADLPFANLVALGTLSDLLGQHLSWTNFPDLQNLLLDQQHTLNDSYQDLTPGSIMQQEHM